MALPTAVMDGDSVLTCVVAAARHTLEAAGATHLHTGGGGGGRTGGSAEADDQGLMPDWGTCHNLTVLHVTGNSTHSDADVRQPPSGQVPPTDGQNRPSSFGSAVRRD